MYTVRDLLHQEVQLLFRALRLFLRVLGDIANGDGDRFAALCYAALKPMFRALAYKPDLSIEASYGAPAPIGVTLYPATVPRRFQSS